MSRWTPRHSVLLSMLLDDVTGTQEIIETRKDLSRVKECAMSTIRGCSYYFTGSKAEGLDLPGSDQDFMTDMYLHEGIEVVEHEPPVKESYGKDFFLMINDDVHPGFTMLRRITPTTDAIHIKKFKDVNGSYFLSSYLLICNIFSIHERYCESVKIQGPSVEHTAIDTDFVPCIHCSFWPSVASEWVRRTRPNGWPSIELINKIVDFGFHLVPIGYPRSSMNMLEWRISFSIAERYLVWSFNHTQMQMYAILKLILKEYIKVNCSPENYVLCSYFIKTFLFWKFEVTDEHFWRIENFRYCLKYLFTEFHNTLQLGKLKHYFIPIFNLLEVNLTRQAQIELLQLWDIVIQYDIKIIEQSRTLKPVWRDFENKMNDSVILQSCVLRNNCAFYNLPNQHFIKNTMKMMREIGIANAYVSEQNDNLACEKFMDSLSSYPDPANAGFVTLFVKETCLIYTTRLNKKRLLASNKGVYSIIRLYDTCSPDIARA